MACCHHYAPITGGDAAFSVDTSAITFGRGCLAEAGAHARHLGMERVAVFTDATIAQLPYLETLLQALSAAGVQSEVFADVRIEPTDRSLREAIAFAKECGPDGYVSLGGGSVIDTCKAANLYATWPAEFDAYVNAPVGDGQPVPGPLKPHIACPTTSGTGSECTGIAVFDYLSLEAKTGIAAPELRPRRALIDPDVTVSLPSSVVAATAFDVLSHALESYTARPFTRRSAPDDPSLRPMSQGANPWSDLGCREALRLLGRYMTRAVADAEDAEAREQVMWAATLAGIAFGNAGVHLPHGMSYSVSGLVRSFRPDGYPQDEPMVPHGMSVIVNAPAVFARTAPIFPERHWEGAQLLGGDQAATVDDAGDVLAATLTDLMRATAMPNGLGGVGYDESDIESLTRGAAVQRRLLDNAPLPVDEALLSELYHDALSYW